MTILIKRGRGLSQIVSQSCLDFQTKFKQYIYKPESELFTSHDWCQDCICPNDPKNLSPPLQWIYRKSLLYETHFLPYCDMIWLKPLPLLVSMVIIFRIVFFRLSAPYPLIKMISFRLVELDIMPTCRWWRKPLTPNYHNNEGDMVVFAWLQVSILIMLCWTL